MKIYVRSGIGSIDGTKGGGYIEILILGATSPHETIAYRSDNSDTMDQYGIDAFGTDTTDP